jgi:hypothetical protein
MHALPFSVCMKFCVEGLLDSGNDRFRKRWILDPGRKRAVWYKIELSGTDSYVCRCVFTGVVEVRITIDMHMSLIFECQCALVLYSGL